MNDSNTNDDMEFGLSPEDTFFYIRDLSYKLNMVEKRLFEISQRLSLLENKMLYCQRTV